MKGVVTTGILGFDGFKSVVTVATYDKTEMKSLVTMVTPLSQDGYAQPYGDTGFTQTRCTDGGWNPGYSKLMKCIQGCKDISGIGRG